MPTLRCQGRLVDVRPGEVALDALLRAGVAIASSCRAGACQSCLVRVTEGAPAAKAQAGLKDTLRAQGYVLACQTVVDADLAVEPPGAELSRGRGTVSSVEPLAAEIAKVSIRLERPLGHRAGQFVNVVRSDGLVRSYSIASPSSVGDEIELHVRRHPNGQMSEWLASPEAVGAPLELGGPHGGCFYVPGRPDDPLLLVGAGTGLAPLWGVLQDALAGGHRGPIRLYHGARSPAGLYLGDQLAALARKTPTLEVRRAVLESGPIEGPAMDVEVGAVDRLALEAHPSLSGFRVYLCGDPTLVNGLRRKVFLAGARLGDIHADAFVMAPAAAAPVANAV